MKENDYIIRSENETDYRNTEILVREAFWNVYRPGCLEHYLLHVLRDEKNFVSELDFVMETGGDIIGQAAFVRTEIDTNEGEKLPVLTLGPICISPKFQRRGWGKVLLDYALSKAEAQGYGAVFLEGNILFYGKCGFDFASAFGIQYGGLPAGEDSSFFLGRELKQGYLKDISGVYNTPSCYLVSETDAENFDKNFPKKKKLKLPGQLF